MIKRISMREDVCTGCRSCEIACSYGNLKVYQPSKSLIKVHFNIESNSMDISSLFSKVTGVSLSASELMLIGQRVRNVEKAFNTIHAGFKRSDDYPPSRFMQEPIRSGPKKDCIIDKVSYDRMLDEYYSLHGWDIKTGWQTISNLEKLNLTEVKEKLQNNGRLINGN